MQFPLYVRIMGLGLTDKRNEGGKGRWPRVSIHAYCKNLSMRDNSRQITHKHRSIMLVHSKFVNGKIHIHNELNLPRGCNSHWDYLRSGRNFSKNSFEKSNFVQCNQHVLPNAIQVVSKEKDMLRRGAHGRGGASCKKRRCWRQLRWLRPEQLRW